ncbi:MAG: hypothetical protein KGI25_08575 [Thaumarchaeota archaeon]|nr:hypothetical protein [Nitrososphaerota archaeon]
MLSYETLESLCYSISNIDKNIQSVAVINKRGRTIGKISRPEFEKQFPSHLSELFCMHHVLQVSMGKDFDENYGPVNYHISERTNHVIITFPLDDNVMLVTTGKNTSPIALARKIIDVIDNSRK